MDRIGRMKSGINGIKSDGTRKKMNGMIDEMRRIE